MQMNGIEVGFDVVLIKWVDHIACTIHFTFPGDCAAHKYPTDWRKRKKCSRINSNSNSSCSSSSNGIGAQFSCLNANPCRQSSSFHWTESQHTNSLSVCLFCIGMIAIDRHSGPEMHKKEHDAISWFFFHKCTRCVTWRAKSLQFCSLTSASGQIGLNSCHFFYFIFSSSFFLLLEFKVIVFISSKLITILTTIMHKIILHERNDNDSMLMYTRDDYNHLNKSWSDCVIHPILFFFLLQCHTLIILCSCGIIFRCSFVTAFLILLLLLLLLQLQQYEQEENEDREKKSF